jgi:inward rectifier potassium channel
MNDNKAPHRERKKDGPAPLRAKTVSRQSRAVIKGQDSSRYRDGYHVVLTAPWWLFFLGALALFAAVNVIFASLYMFDPQGITNARPGSFWDAFRFSVQTIGSVNSDMLAKSTYVNIIVTFEAFFGILNLAVVTGATFARFSRPFARVIFSNVALITPFDGVPTLMFRAANQRGNQIFDASMTVWLARQMTTKEGVVWRRFQEIPLMRSRSPLFALSWTIMHRVDEQSPLHGATIDELNEAESELIVLLSGTDETLADTIYARHSYTAYKIRMNERFVDVLSVSDDGRRVVDLSKFHDTEPVSP